MKEQKEINKVLIIEILPLNKKHFNHMDEAEWLTLLRMNPIVKDFYEWHGTQREE